MGFNVQAIRYGWVALASLGVLTGTTIYVTNNQRHQVKPQDVIEVVLGAYERFLALQTGKNALGEPTYPFFVRTWTDTNGESISVTNTIGWHTDRAMMISLDATIKQLVPYYVDTNTVYDGTTNIVMLTVPGLWASLNIGDKTNKFTREPCWTNPVSTNWTVNYTSYWPSTNGVATNINYTSDYRQVVNYAKSWTATGGHVWVTSSNWASEIVVVTNVVTYGDLPWRIYKTDLEERYKVLNALKMSAISFSRTGYSKQVSVSLNSGDPSVIGQLMSDLEDAYDDADEVQYEGEPFAFSYISKWMDSSWSIHWDLTLARGYNISSAIIFDTNITHGTIQAYVLSDTVSVPFSNPRITEIIFDSQGDNITNNGYSAISSIGDAFVFGASCLSIPSWPEVPSENTHMVWKGYTVPVGNGLKFFIPWNFQYCANKYW
jgi:hypothetical protein